MALAQPTLTRQMRELPLTLVGSYTTGPAESLEQQRNIVKYKEIQVRREREKPNHLPEEPTLLYHTPFTQFISLDCYQQPS